MQLGNKRAILQAVAPHHGHFSGPNIPHNTRFSTLKVFLSLSHTFEHGFSIADLHSIYVLSIVATQWLHIVISAWHSTLRREFLGQSF